MPRDFRSKIDQIEAETGFTQYRLGLDSGLSNGALQAAYKNNRELSPDKLAKFLAFWKVNKEWWDSGKGEVINKKSTQVEKFSEEVSMEAYKHIIEGNTPYILQHQSIIEQYRMVPHEIIKMLSQNSVDKATLEEKYEKLVKKLEAEIEELRKKLPPDVTR
jgi:hypothetical protein